MGDIIDLYPDDSDPLPDEPISCPEDADPRAFLNSPRGHFIAAKALDLAIKSIDQMPEKRRPYSDRDHMRFILDNCFARWARTFREIDQLVFDRQVDGRDGLPDDPA